MSKGIAFAVGYSIFLLLLFSGMCYLITTVNPPPLKIVQEGNGSRRFFSLNLKPLIVNDFAVGDAEYGLEKVEEDEFLPPNPLSFYIQTSTRIDELKAADIPKPITVSPPTWPSSPDPKDLYKFTSIDIDVSNDGASLKYEPSSNKAHRRSVKKIDNIAGTIVFKVLDDSGRPRIEIKLGDLTTKNYTINKFKRNSKFSVSTASDYDAGVEKTILTDNDVIKIMPNDTVVIYDDENSSDTGVKDYVHDSRTADHNDFVEALIADIDRNAKQLATENSRNNVNTKSQFPHKYDLNKYEGKNTTVINIHNVTNSF